MSVVSMFTWQIDLSVPSFVPHLANDASVFATRNREVRTLRIKDRALRILNKFCHGVTCLQIFSLRKFHQTCALRWEVDR